jgi:hypothetical protein
MALNKDQKKFIKDKVKKLGSVEAVQKDYKRKDLVSEFALEYAEKIFKKRKKNESTVNSR